MRILDWFKKKKPLRQATVVSPSGHIEKEIDLPNDSTVIEYRREGIKDITREGNMDRRRIEKEVHEECATCPCCGSKDSTEETRVFWGERVIEHHHICNDCDCCWRVTAKAMNDEINRRLEEFKKNKNSAQHIAPPITRPEEPIVMRQEERAFFMPSMPLEQSIRRMAEWHQEPPAETHKIEEENND